MTNAEQFLDHYIAVERILRKYYGSKGRHDTFLQLVTIAETKSSLIKNYASDLREYGELRNAIIHNRTPEENAIIAEPHSFVVEQMANIRRSIEHPIRIKDVMTKPVYKAKLDDNITQTAQKMYNNIYTHVPVYNDDKFVGVLSESALLRWVGELSKTGRQLDSKRTIKEMEHQLDQPGNKFNDFEFIPKNTLVLDTKSRFEKALAEGRRLGAIFVTKTGKNTDKVEGLITAWDLPRLRPN